MQAEREAAPDLPFEVELAQSNKIFTVMPDQSIMQALRQERVRIDPGGAAKASAALARLLCWPEKPIIAT